MKAIFIFHNNIQPNLDDLLYTDADGNTCGGFTLLESPDTERTYWIDASQNFINQMKKDTTSYTWIKDVLDEQ